MQEIEDIKDRLHPHFENPEQEQEVEQIHSEYLRDCREFYGLRSEDALERMEGELIQAIQAHGIAYDAEQQFCEEPIVRIANHSNNYEVVEVEVKVGYFTFKSITIANIDTLFPYHLAKQEGCGSFGTVFQACFEDQPIAIKASFFKKEKNERIVPQEVGSTIKMLLRQFCLSKIASIIGVGPTISSQMGFDLMIYNDCVAYAMEYCQNQNYAQPFALYRSQLQEKLFKLHAIKFIHMDIKEDNICYSKVKKDYVIIDYGLSKIIKEEIGRKSLTHFFGTASHCSEEMGLLISNFKEDYVDLYYNDICCLNSSLQSDKQYWKNNKKHTEVDRIYSKLEAKPMERYEKTVIVLYLKFLLYKFKVERFRQVFKKHLHSLKKVQIEQILVFIKGFAFSSSLFLVLREFSEAIKHDAFDKANREVFLSEENNEFFQHIFAILEDINKIEEKKKVKTTKDAEKEREMLNQMNIVERLNWKIYVKLLIDSIQINKNTCSFKDKNELCATAKKLFARGYIPDLVLLEQRQSELEQVSESLFRFSLTQPINKTKIAIFHSIIYNIVLLHIMQLQEIFEIYKALLYLPLEISDRARMLLKIKTTLFLRQFQVTLSYADRIAITDRLNSIDEEYYGTERHLKESERQFLKAATMSYLHMQTKASLSLIKQSYKKMITQNVYSEYLKSQDLARQIQVWYLCIWISQEQSSQKLAALESLIFRQMNNIDISFEYFHIALLISLDTKVNPLNAIWIANLFQQIFDKTVILDNYYLNIVLFIVDLKKGYYHLYEDFICKIKSNIRLERVKPSSCFGRMLNIQLHQLLLNKRVQKLSQVVRSFYLDNKDFLVSYDTDIPCKQVQPFLLVHLSTFFMEDFYGSKFYSNANEVIDRNFQGVYFELKGKVLKMPMRHMNTGIIILLMLASYILYRRKSLKKVLDIFNATVATLPLLQQYDDTFLHLKLKVMQFYFRLAVSYTFKTSKIASVMSIYYQFNEIIQEKSTHTLLLQRQHAFCQLYLFLLYEFPEKVATLINKLSYAVMVRNQVHTAAIYYSILDQLIRLPHFMKKMVQVNKSIVNVLQDTRINPYNGVYLHHMMCFRSLWSHRLFLQICRIFNFVPKNIANQILQNYYKYVYMYYPMHNNRKKCFLERLIMKYSNIYDITPSKLLIMMVPRKSFNILQQYRNIEKLRLIKQKTISYYMSYKSQKIYTKYKLIARQDEYTISKNANTLKT